MPKNAKKEIEILNWVLAENTRHYTARLNNPRRDADANSQRLTR
jgi:hypothetical protein